MKQSQPTAILLSLVITVAMPLAPEVAEARSLLGRAQHLISAMRAPKTSAAAKVPEEIITANRWPQQVASRDGRIIHFQHAHEKGRLGDRLTALRLTGRGYQKLPSKYDGVHGIDGVYVKRDVADEIIEIRLVESKVDSARLHAGPPPQMSDKWIRSVCAKMQDQSTPAADTARLILANIDSPKLKRELWHHDLASGRTNVRAVDPGGKPRQVTEAWEDQLVANELARQCSQARLMCEATNADAKGW